MNVEPRFDLEKVFPISFEGEHLNVDDDVIHEQVAHAIRLGLPQAMPYDENHEVVALVCGGPSLAETERELVEAHWSGAKIVTVNGAYKWCVERNLKPSATVVLDAREFNQRFADPAVIGCRYLLASQCHPSTFEACRGRDVLLWHALSTGDPEVELLDAFYGGHLITKDDQQGHGCYFPITLGTTVGLRAISLMRMLGFRRFHIFGLDSCWLGDRHHAYEQSENNDDGRLNIWLKPEGIEAKRFVCSTWQAKQAEDFMKLVQERGNLFDINVHGPGLIATMIRTGADMEIEGG